MANDRSPAPGAQYLGRLRAKTLTTEHQRAAGKARAALISREAKLANLAKAQAALAAKRKAAKNVD